MTLTTKTLAVAGVLVLLGSWACAEDFYILLHPGTGLTADSQLLEKPGDRRNASDVIGMYSKSKPRQVVGSSAKDAPDTTSFILFLENPRIATFSAIQGGDTATARNVRVPYKGVVVVQPFSFWHRAAGAKPELLGRSFYWGRAEQLHVLNFNGSTMTLEVLNLSVDDMIHKAVAEKLDTLAERIADSWSPGLINQPPTVNLAPEKILEWGGNIGKSRAYPPPRPGVPLQQWMEQRARASGGPAPVPDVKTSYKPSRVNKDAGGNFVIEVDLFNRLPIEAHGVLDCRDMPVPAGKDEFAKPAPRLRRVKTPARGLRYNFDLMPGQKDVAKFTLPGDAADIQAVREMEIKIEPLASYLGQEPQ